jgi:hypothetical protein
VLLLPGRLDAALAVAGDRPPLYRGFPATPKPIGGQWNWRARYRRLSA